jgi:hypothetical protein
MLTKLKAPVGFQTSVKNTVVKKRIAVKIFVVFPCVCICSALLICHEFAGLSKVTG